MKTYWVESNFSMNGSIIARVSSRREAGLISVKILKLFYTSGKYNDWHIGDRTAVTQYDILRPYSTIKFIFEDMR